METSLAEVPWKRDAKEGNSPVCENGFHTSYHHS